MNIMYQLIRKIKFSSAICANNMTFLVYMVLIFIQSTKGQCPWQKEVPDLQHSCLCAYNLAQELSVQCDQVRKIHFV